MLKLFVGYHSIPVLQLSVFCTAIDIIAGFEILRLCMYCATVGALRLVYSWYCCTDTHDVLIIGVDLLVLLMYNWMWRFSKTEILVLFTYVAVDLLKLWHTNTPFVCCYSWTSDICSLLQLMYCFYWCTETVPLLTVHCLHYYSSDSIRVSHVHGSGAPALIICHICYWYYSCRLSGVVYSYTCGKLVCYFFHVVVCFS